MTALKYIGAGLVGVVVGLLLAGFYGEGMGGTYEVTRQFFPGGIDLTESGDIQVDGTTVIDDSGNVDAPITSTTGTFSSTLTNKEANSSLVGSTTLTSTQSNTTFYMDTSGGSTTLPAVATATGTVFRFTIASAITSTYNVEIRSAEGDNIEGSTIVAGAVVDCDASDRLAFISDGENLGDFVELRSNGQKWFVTQSNALTSAKLVCDG